MAGIISSIFKGAAKGVGRGLLKGVGSVLSDLQERTGAPNITSESADTHTTPQSFSDARLPVKEQPITLTTSQKDINLDRTFFKSLRIDQDDFLKSLNQLSEKTTKEINIVNSNVLKGHDFTYKQQLRQAQAINLVATRVNTVQKQQRDLLGEFSKVLIANEELKRLMNKRTQQQAGQPERIVEQKEDTGG